MHRPFSLRRMVLICVLISIIPIDILFIILLRQSANTVYEKTAESYAITLQAAATQLAKTLSETESEMAALYVESYEVRYLKNNASPGERYRYGYRALQDLKLGLPDNGVSFVYDGDFLHYIRGSDVSSSYLNDYSTLGRQLVQDVPYTQGWKIYQVNGNSFLVRLVGGDDVYFGKMLLLDDTLLSGILETGNGITFFQQPNGQPLNKIEKLSTLSFLSETGSWSYFLFPTGDYLLLSCPVGSLPFTLSYALPASDLRDSLQSARNAFLISLLLSASAICFIITALHRYMTIPLRQMKASILSFQDSHFQTITPNQTAKEIQEVSDTLRDAAGEIHQLRIRSYEEKIAHQELEMQYRQLQLRPHFYLNCLKSLYGLAEKGQTGDIQKMILSLSEQFQFLTYNMASTVPLQEELAHTQNYVTIQKLGKGFPIQSLLSIDRTLEEVPVPTLCIQTFVENSIKYGPVPGRELEIHICVSKEGEGEDSFIHITVEDNGNGYPSDLLTSSGMLNVTEEQVKKAVGLYNLQTRLTYIYGGKAFMFLSNRPGAVSELLLPLSAQRREPDENSHC